MARDIRVLVTAGPTREHLDPVRFLSNASTGAQGAALAEEALARGFAVDVVHGPIEAALPPGARSHPVVSALEMLEAARSLHPACDVLIGAAAVSDFRPREAAPRKVRRGGGVWTVELVPTADILLELGKAKGTRVHAGFALETEDLVEGGLRKLREKGLDWLVANSPEAIGAAAGRYWLLGADGTREDLGQVTKRELARRLFDAILGTLSADQAPGGSCR
ncbi:MAG: phosphopantothenoylcysteine decarboxylase [Planctomycetes bacterium]|nr:phosphopantothenoylcysteine decarboxylase [Planctomycetota bacterium]